MIRSRRTPLMLGSISAAGMAVVLLSLSGHSVSVLFTVLFMLGFLASAQVLVFAVGEDDCQPGMSATTVSFTNLLVMLGGFVLQPVVGIILDRIYDFNLALLVLPLGLVLASVLTFYLKESYK